MRAYPAAVVAHWAARKTVLCHTLLWLAGRDRDTGTLERLGLWTGDDHQQITVGGWARTYYGAGNIVGLDAITQRSALEVRQHRITLSPLAPEVVQAVRIYDPRLAPIEMHEWYFDPETMRPLAAPVRVFSGHIIQAPISTPAEGGDATCTITMVSSAWTLTRPLTLKRSSAALQAREAGDLFRQYQDISGAVETAWGEKLGTVEGATAPVEFKRRYA